MSQVQRAGVGGDRDEAADREAADREAAIDAALVVRARAGDADATRDLVRRHLRTAHRVALAILGDVADAEDACQEAFAAVLARLDRCHPEHKFRPWLLQCVRNRALSTLRWRRRHGAASLGAGAGEVDVAAPSSFDPRLVVERAELRTRLEAALALLPVEQRVVVVLHDVEGWRHREIAAALGIAEATSRGRLFDARRRLRRQLGEPREARRAAVR